MRALATLYGDRQRGFDNRRRRLIPARRPLPLAFIPPCIPTWARHAPVGRDWVHEIKHEPHGSPPGRTDRLFTRRGYDWSHRFPLIVEAAGALRVSSISIDGENLAAPAGARELRLRRSARRTGGVSIRGYRLDSVAARVQYSRCRGPPGWPPQPHSQPRPGPRHPDASPGSCCGKCLP